MKTTLVLIFLLLVCAANALDVRYSTAGDFGGLLKGWDKARIEFTTDVGDDWPTTEDREIFLYTGTPGSGVDTGLHVSVDNGVVAGPLIVNVLSNAPSYYNDCDPTQNRSYYFTHYYKSWEGGYVTIGKIGAELIFSRVYAESPLNERIVNYTATITLSSLPPDPGATKPMDRMAGGNAGSQATENHRPISMQCGMPQYSVHSQVVSLHLTDTPLSYTPAFGPAIDFTVNYNQKDVQPVSPDTASDVGFTNFGSQQWTFNWLSYVTDDPSDQDEVKVYVRGGGTESYAGYNSMTNEYDRDAQSHSLLIQTTSDSYEKQFPDGHRYFFTHVDGSTVYPRRIFLTKVIDPHGNEVNLAYDEFNRLETITDATGKETTLSYEEEPEWYYRVTKVTDPFGRSASFEYDENGRLSTITDAIDLTSEVTYKTGGNFIESLETPYGTTQFAYGENSIQRWIEITDPLNVKERIEYCENAPGTADSDTAPALFFNTELGRRNTFYWDKKAFAAAPGDYTKAHVTHWLKSADGTTTVSIPASEKPALEARVWYEYAGQAAGNLAGTSSKPAKIARVLSAGTQLSQITYNDLGNVMSSIDPVGRETTYIYDPMSPIDLLEVHNTTTGDDLLVTYSDYVNHQPETIIDAAGQSTAITYNARGQVETVTNANAEVTEFVYNETEEDPEFGRLLTTTRAVGTGLEASTTYDYDDYGRVESMTDSENYTLTFAYDSIGGALKTLDRVTKVTFPDTTYQEARYDDIRWPLDVAHTRDRLGRVTAYEYDAVRNRLKITDPQGRLTRFVHCPCGAMDKIIDPRLKETEWTRDLQMRIETKKIDGEEVARYEYDDAGRLLSVTDALDQVITYGYTLDNRVETIEYTDEVHATADVELTYDPVYPRLSTMTDGTGVTTYAYVPINSADAVYGDGLPLSVDGPLADDTIAYVYDELGRTTERTINGGVNETTLAYDALGRITGVNNSLGAFIPDYVNETGRLDHVLWPNGQRTNFAWKNNPNDPRLESITHLDPTPLTQSEHTYGYDVQGRISTWQTETTASNTKFTFGYNLSDELEEATLRAEPTPTLLNQFNYGYDDSGNRVNVTEDGKFTSYPADDKNQLTTASGTGSMLFRGTVNEASTVTLESEPATMLGLNWSAWADVAPGANSLELTATETTVAPGFAAQTTTRHISLTLTADANRTFVYDDNGNMIDNGGTETYEWDAANRLVAINYTGTDLRTEFTYDGLGRRVKIVEKDNGIPTDTKQFVWEGLSIAEERDGSNDLTRQYFGQGEMRGMEKLFYARDHLGSIREMTDAAGVVQASYEYSPWGKRDKIGGALDCDFGFTGHYEHAPSDLVLAPLRFYSPELGRWLSRDPIEEAGGMNLYGYVTNNIVNVLDPLGLEESLILYNPLDPLLSKKIPAARAIPATPGWFTLAGEGNSSTIYDENGKAMNAEETLAKLNQKGWDGKQPVWLKSCQAGMARKDGQKPIAQQMHEISGAMFRAPNTGHVYDIKTSAVYNIPFLGRYGGKVSVTDRLVNPWTGRTDFDGRWITFK